MSSCEIVTSHSCEKNYTAIQHPRPCKRKKPQEFLLAHANPAQKNLFTGLFCDADNAGKRREDSSWHLKEAFHEKGEQKVFWWNVPRSTHLSLNFGKFSFKLFICKYMSFPIRQALKSPFFSRILKEDVRVFFCNWDKGKRGEDTTMESWLSNSTSGCKTCPPSPLLAILGTRSFLTRFSLGASRLTTTQKSGGTKTEEKKSFFLELLFFAGNESTLPLNLPLVLGRRRRRRFGWFMKEDCKYVVRIRCLKRRRNVHERNFPYWCS